MKFKDIRAKKHKRNWEEYVHGIERHDVWEHLWNTVGNLHQDNVKDYSNHLDYKYYEDLLTPRMHDYIVEMYRDKWNKFMEDELPKLQTKTFDSIYNDIREDKDLMMKLNRVYKKAIRRRKADETK